MNVFSKYLQRILNKKPETTPVPEQNIEIPSEEDDESSEDSADEASEDIDISESEQENNSDNDDN